MVKNILLACVLTAAGGYLLGSILFGVLISKVMYNDDVRNHGSGNAGMTNVLRTYGKLPAVLTTIGDVGKSVAAVSLGRFIFDALLSGTGAAWQSPLDPVCGAYLAAIFCMIGHSRPIFFGFKGGKGVLVGAGAALATEPLVCAVLLAIFLIEVAVTRIVSLGSIIIAALYPVGTLINLIARGANLPTILFSKGTVNGFCTELSLLLHYFIHVFRHGELGSSGKGRQVAEYGCYRSRGLYVRRAAGVPHG